METAIYRCAVLLSQISVAARFRLSLVATMSNATHQDDRRFIDVSRGKQSALMGINRAKQWREEQQ